MALTTNIISNIPQLTQPIYNILQQGRFNPVYKETVLSGFGTNMWSSFIEAWADEDFIGQPTWNRVEEQYDAKVLTVNAATISPTGTTITIATPYKISGTYTNVQPGFLLAAPSIGKTLYVASVNTSSANAFTMVVYPYDSTYTGAIAQGATLLVMPVNARNEGACNIGDSSSFVPGLNRTYSMGILSRTYQVTRTAAQSFTSNLQIYKSVVDYGNGPQVIDTLWSNDLQNMYEEFYYGREAVRLLGEDITNTTNVTIKRSMTGLMPQLRAKAQNVDFSKSAGYTTTDYTNLAYAIKKKRGYCNTYFLYGGMNWRGTSDDALKADFPNGAINYDVFSGMYDYNSAQGGITTVPAGQDQNNGGNKERSIAYGFTGVQKEGISFFLHDLQAFNDESFGGAAGFNYPYTFFGMPACPMLTPTGYKKGIVCTYLGDNGTGMNSSHIMRDFGILREGSYIGCDYHQFDLIDEEGFEVVAADRWLLGQGT